MVTSNLRSNYDENKLVVLFQEYSCMILSRRPMHKVKLLP